MVPLQSHGGRAPGEFLVLSHLRQESFRKCGVLSTGCVHNVYEYVVLNKEEERERNEATK
jgi:hypothetical protein